MGLGVEPGTSLFKLLWAMIKDPSKGLKLDDASALALVHKRVAQGSVDRTIEILMECDECYQVLDKHDHHRIQEAQKTAENEEVDQEEFRQSYLEMATTINGGGKQKDMDAAAVPTLITLSAHHLASGEANRFNKPPGSFVWRDVKRGGWCGHVPPYKRVSEPFVKHGGSSITSFRACLRGLWIQYAAKVAKSPKDVCFVEGLFS